MPELSARTAELLPPLSPGSGEMDAYGSRMLPRFGLPLELLSRVFFARIDAESCELAPVRKASEEGSLVYVMRTRSLLDYLYFNYFLLKKGLPLARFANGVRTTAVAPLARAARAVWRRVRWRREQRRPLPDPVESGYVVDLLERGDPLLVFLRRGRRRLFGVRETSRDLVEVLIEAQKVCSQPIFFVPQILVWERQPDRTNRGLADILLGDQDNPGFLRKTLIFLLYHRRAVVRVGEPVNLQEFIQQQEGQSTARVAKKLRWLLLGYLFRERKVVKGPDVRPRRWLFDRILAQPEVRAAINTTARQEGRSVLAIEKRARKILDKTGADYRWWVITLFRSVMDLVLARIYSGFEFEPEDVERIRDAARKGTVLLLPSHRSHFDYLLLSLLLYHQGMMPPHIAAGNNLSFFPMGTLFRRAGAFFIRRSFRGDVLYTTLLNHYIRALTSEGYTQEFFIEGGRSRTGKMLPPKIGLLGSYMEAMADRIVQDIVVVPVYIAYERVVEDYSAELAGAEKKKESAGELVKASSVLRKRFGRIYVKTNEPISLKESMEILDGPWRSLSEDKRKDYLKRFAHHVVAEIQDVTVVTPSSVAAVALLGHDRRGITRARFHRRCLFLRSWLDARGALFSDAWQFPDDALDETIELFASERWVELLPEPEGGADGADDILAIAVDAGPRMQMDYYRNSILFHFVPAAFLCTSVVLGEDDTEDLANVRRRFEVLVDLFQEEFFFHPDLPTEFLLRQAGRRLQELGVLKVVDPALSPEALAERTQPDPGPWLDELSDELDPDLSVTDPAAAGVLIATIRSFFEAYYVVLKGSRVLRSGTLTEKELAEAAMKVGRRMFLTEDVTRPEAVSKVNLTNAVRHFRQKGVLLPLEGTGHGRDAKLTLDEEARERYMGPMRKLFHSGRLRPDGARVR